MSTTPIDPTQHEIRYKYTFNKQWDDYWSNRPEIQAPTPAEKLEMLKRCIYVPPEDVGFQMWEHRHAFRHPDMEQQLMFAVLEGVTTWKPNGQLVFLGMTEWRTGRVRHPKDRPPKFVPPSPTWPVQAQRSYAERKAKECQTWIEINGPKHPNYVEVQDAKESFLRILDLTEKAPSYHSRMSELEDIREEVKRSKVR
jgi:hypothetical protein